MYKIKSFHYIKIVIMVNSVVTLTAVFSIYLTADLFNRRETTNCRVKCPDRQGGRRDQDDHKKNKNAQFFDTRPALGMGDDSCPVAVLRFRAMTGSQLHSVSRSAGWQDGAARSTGHRMPSAAPGRVAVLIGMSVRALLPWSVPLLSLGRLSGRLLVSVAISVAM